MKIKANKGGEGIEKKGPGERERRRKGKKEKEKEKNGEFFFLTVGHFLNLKKKNAHISNTKNIKHRIGCDLIIAEGQATRGQMKGPMT